MGVVFFAAKPFLINKQSGDNAVRVDYSEEHEDIFGAPDNFKYYVDRLGTRTSDAVAADCEVLERLHTCISDAIAANHEVMLKFEIYPYLDFDDESDDYEEWIIKNIRAIHKDVSIEPQDMILPTWMSKSPSDNGPHDDDDY